MKISPWIPLLLLLIYILLQLLPSPKKLPSSHFKSKNRSRPLVIAHGGAKLLNPENTWMAFDYAFNLGVDVLEINLQITKDNQLVSYHNNLCSDLSSATGYIYDYTYNDLKDFNFGENFTNLDGAQPYKNLSSKQLQSYNGALSIANLEEMFIRYGKNIYYICELKNNGELGKQSAKKILELVINYSMEDYVCIASFDAATLDYVLSIAPKNIITSFHQKSAASFIIANYLGFGLFMNYSHRGFQLPLHKFSFFLASPYLIYKIHKYQLFVHFWTVNKLHDFEMCVKLKADGIITDRPDLLLHYLNTLTD